MQIVQGNMLTSLRGIQAFLDAHTDELGTVALSGSRKKLDTLVAQLSQHAANQGGGSLTAQGATQKQYALRQALLRDYMMPVSRIAASDLPNTPELEPLRMPRGTPNTELLAKAANAMANVAAPYSSTFIAAGLPQDFIAQLNAAAAALLVPVDTRKQSRGTSQGATEGLATLLSSAKKIVRVLDALVRSALKTDPSLLANWEAVKRPPVKPGRPAAAPVAPAVPAVPAVPASTSSAAAPASKTEISSPSATAPVA